MKIGLFFGSFNPVHIGHMIVANYMVEYSDLDKLWMVLTPQNPLKEKSDLANNYDRLHLLDLAIGDHRKIQWSQVEFSLPKPSYTIHTLRHLTSEYPTHEFVLVIGSDLLRSFHLWKEYEEILSKYEIYVYRREVDMMNPFEGRGKIKLFSAPLIEVSGSAIRKAIKAGKSVQYLVPQNVYEYLNSSRLYRQ